MTRYLAIFSIALACLIAGVSLAGPKSDAPKFESDRALDSDSLSTEDEIDGEFPEYGLPLSRSESSMGLFFAREPDAVQPQFQASYDDRAPVTVLAGSDWFIECSLLGVVCAAGMAVFTAYMRPTPWIN